MRRRFYSVLWIAVIWWTGYAVIFAAQVMSMAAEQGTTILWSEAFKFSFGGWMTWIPLSVGLYWVVHDFPVQRENRLRSLLVLTLAALVVVLIRAAYVYATNPVFNWYEDLPGFSSVLLTSFEKNLLLAWTVIGMAHGLVFYERANERSKRVAELEVSLATARLEALHAQLNPHFLFNTLNSVAELVHDDPHTADRMLVAISMVLRDSLAVDQAQARELHREIELVENYLLIEKIRLGDRLRVQWDVDETCLDEFVPVLSLQLLVENAVVHALSRSRQGGQLVIRAGVTDGYLFLEVENDVPVTEHEGRVGGGLGLGLRSIGERMRLLYGEAGEISRSKTQAAGGRHLVRLRFPKARQPMSPGSSTAGLA